MVAIGCGMPSYISLPLVDSRTHIDTLELFFVENHRKFFTTFCPFLHQCELWIDSSEQRNIPNAWGEIPVDDGVGKEIVRIAQLRGEKKKQKTSNLQL